jgi:hypothetical protein
MITGYRFLRHPRADLVMRGFAKSFVTAATVAGKDSLPV